MPNGSFSSHYVPRLVLRKFSNRLCTYNIKTGELRENIAPEHTFAQNALYDQDVYKRQLQIYAPII